MEGSPKDCGQFHVETADKLFVFAAEMVELDDWTQKLCEIAFPVRSVRSLVLSGLILLKSRGITLYMMLHVQFMYSST